MFALLKITLLVPLCLTRVISLDLYDILAHKVILDTDANYHLSWDFDDEKIVFDVTVKTLGYIGFGISPNGDMKGADIVIAGVDSRGKVYLSDRHATGREEPEIDSNEFPDWRIVSGSQTDSHTQVRFWRALDTCDEEDRIITGDTIRVIWSYHTHDWEAAKIQNGGYHGDHRGTKSILLLNPQKEQPSIPEDSYTVDIVNNRTKVPSQDTTYWCEGFSMQGFQQKEHVIKFEPIIQHGNERLVHHIVLLSCPVTVSNRTAGMAGQCFTMFTGGLPIDWMTCFTAVFAWGVGGSPFYFPEHVGFPLGLDDSPKVFILQTHYDNPKGLSDNVDSSGIRLTISRKLREHDAALLVTGVIPSPAHVIPPHAEQFRTDGYCVPECITQALGNVSEINVFATLPHAHLLGRAMKLRHFRNGKELIPITVDDNYDFTYQEIRLLKEEVKVQQGDHLITECTYNSLNRTNVTFGGERTNDEMCDIFVLYYPPTALASCYSGADIDILGQFANVSFFQNATVREPESLRGQSLESIFNNINWNNKWNRDEFQKLVTSYHNPVQVQCLADGIPLAFGKTVKLPEIRERLPKPVPVCKFVSDAVTSPSPGRSIYYITMVTMFLFL